MPLGEAPGDDGIAIPGIDDISCDGCVAGGGIFSIDCPGGIAIPGIDDMSWVALGALLVAVGFLRAAEALGRALTGFAAVFFASDLVELFFALVFLAAGIVMPGMFIPGIFI